MHKWCREKIIEGQGNIVVKKMMFAAMTSCNVLDEMWVTQLAQRSPGRSIFRTYYIAIWLRYVESSNHLFWAVTFFIATYHDPQLKDAFVGKKVYPQGCLLVQENQVG